MDPVITLVGYDSEEDMEDDDEDEQNDTDDTEIYTSDSDENDGVDHIIGAGGDADHTNDENHGGAATDVGDIDEEDDADDDDDIDDDDIVFSICRNIDDQAQSEGKVEWVFCDYCDSWIHLSCDRRRDGRCKTDDKVFICLICKQKLK